MQAGAAATLRFIDAEVNYKCLELCCIVVTTGPKYRDSWLDNGTMRLICPNCGAQYEVADDAIPPSGRDVQCSNCGHAWFQHQSLAEIDEAEVVEAFAQTEPAPAQPEQAPVSDPVLPHTPEPAAPEPEHVAAAVVETPPEPIAEPVVEPVAEPVIEPVADPVVAATPIEPPVVAAAAPIHDPAPQPRNSLDDNLLAVLREEAEREVAQRRAEAARGLEVQTELGIEALAAAPAPPPPPPMSAASKPKTQDFSYLSSDADLDTTVPEASVRPAARRDLLPDVEVISSTLRSSSGAGDDDNPMPDLPPIRRSGGFRSGFLLAVLLAVIVVVAYVLAPSLAEQFPAAKGTLDAYVATIDALRLWVGSVVANLTGILESQS